MSDQKRNPGLFWLAVVCSILFSTSGWMVVWLKESFSPFGQLMVRAGVAFVVSYVWVLLVDKKLDLSVVGKYNKWLLIFELLCRPAFNFCFIMAATALNGTAVLMVLLLTKMLTNVLYQSFSERKKPSRLELLGYILVALGIVVYGWGVKDIFGLSMLWAAASGFLEAARLELIKLLNVDKEDRPKLSMLEFVGMFVVALLAMIVTQSSFFVSTTSVVTAHSYWALSLAALSVIILAIDYYLSPRIPTGIYSAILATEVGFAGVINYLALGTPLGSQQIVGLLVSIVAILVIGVATSKSK